MSSTKISTPVEGFTGSGVGGLQFTDGVAYTDNEGLIQYCREAGYGIGDDEPGNLPLNPSELVELRRQMGILAPDVDPSISDEDLLELLASERVSPADVRKAIAEPIDPRQLENGGVSPVGTQLRDAAVDPHPEDFLPPTNAGVANPHGPLVVAPQIHASGTHVVRPGEVYVDDVDKQEAAETEHATKLLVDGESVEDAVDTFDRGDENGEGGSETGPLGLSDPGSVEQGVAAAQEAADGAPAPASTYDPAGYGVDEVNSYLDEASDAERARVLELEAAADGKQRKGILEGRHGTEA